MAETAEVDTAWCIELVPYKINCIGEFVALLQLDRILAPNDLTQNTGIRDCRIHLFIRLEALGG